VITTSCQRWELGREHRRPAGETIRTAEYEVTAIAGDVARTFVETHHYARSCSPTAHPFGLYRSGALSGVAVFGPLPSMNAHRAVFPTLSTTEGVTLGRLVLLDGVPGNGESYFVARCFALLREAGIVGVESCADPEPRAALDGSRVHRGHVGCVYQATNGRYIGKTNPATLRLLPNGTVFSNRASGKVVRAEQGRRYSGAALVDWGADPLKDGEDPAEWIRTWRPRLTRPMRHQGNHRYIWTLDKRRRAELFAGTEALSYPKIGWA
jgi:hypothetical protein